MHAQGVTLFFQENKSITELNLSANGLSLEAARSIAALLKVHRLKRACIECVCRSTKRVETLWLENNRFCAHSASEVASALKVWFGFDAPHLQQDLASKTRRPLSIFFSRNDGISDAGARTIADALKARSFHCLS